MMKITDKMRLDWMQKSVEVFRPIIVDVCLSTEDSKCRCHWGLRRAIDAAIRAGERNKI